MGVSFMSLTNAEIGATIVFEVNNFFDSLFFKNERLSVTLASIGAALGFQFLASQNIYW